MAKISIIVPVYNVEDYVERCLLSIKNQTFKDIEVIVVNDGSIDNSKAVVEKTIKGDKRFKLYNKENGGLSDARNYGMKYAKGEYLAFVDSDDYIHETMYEKMYDLAIREKADLVECDLVWRYPKKDVIDETKIRDDDLTNIRVMACNKLYKKEIIEKNNITFTKGVRYEDVDWCYKVLANINKIVSLHEPLYIYIQREGSIANNQNEKVRDIFVVLKNIITYYKEKKIYKEKKEDIEYLFIRILLGSSFKRILGIKNLKLRYKILKENYIFLNKNFPDWKRNTILRKNKTLKNIYYRSINIVTYYIYSVLLKVVVR